MDSAGCTDFLVQLQSMKVNNAVVLRSILANADHQLQLYCKSCLNKTTKLLWGAVYASRVPVCEQGVTS